MLQRAFFLLLFLLSFLAATAWIRGLVPERLKIEWFEEVQEEVDVVFLGSSHVFRQFDPALFDSLRGAEDSSLRSLNLGTLGMEFPEEMYLVQRILKHKPQHLRWIIVEAQPFDVHLRNLNDFGMRRIGWHSSGVTWMLVRAILLSELPWVERWDLIRRHTEHWWRRTINLARGLDVIATFGRPPLAPFEDLSALGSLRDGYVPLEMATASQRNRSMRKGFLQAPGAMERGRQALLQGGYGGDPDGDLLDAVQRVERMAAEAGVGIVWWLHPNLERYPGWRKMLEQGDLHYLIAYDDPARFPDFYQVDLRFDLFHLNRQGSEQMTEDFTHEFLALTGNAVGR